MRASSIPLIFLIFATSAFADCVTYDFSKHLVNRISKYPQDTIDICENNTYIYNSHIHGGDGSWVRVDAYILQFDGPLKFWGEGEITSEGIEFDYENN
nr:MAG: hypothetical protein BECKMB1821I_GA0114274_10245 [Candidatus Kentron sp. MB]VFK75529.1 MAG: hypothetical protein BECKMB1821H_GA0114242_10254 [Candidatus Kentron sp. MB]